MINIMNQALMVGALTPPQHLILCVICNKGWRLVKIRFYVYFNMRWGRRHAHHFVLAAKRSNACSMLKDRNVRDYTTCCEPFRKCDIACISVYCFEFLKFLIIKNTMNTLYSWKIESLRITFFVKLIQFDASRGILESKTCPAPPSTTGLRRFGPRPQTLGSVETPTTPS